MLLNQMMALHERLTQQLKAARVMQREVGEIELLNMLGQLKATGRGRKAREGLH